MGTLLAFGLLAGTGLVALRHPWVGVVGAYVLSVLAPQFIWFWNFDGLRPVLLVMAPTLVGFAIALASGRISTVPLRSGRNLLMLLLFLAYTVSYFFGPYTRDASRPRATDPAWAYDIIVNMFVLFAVATTCITTTRRLVALGGVIVLTGVYLTYWANDLYLATRMVYRMSGPTNASGAGIYNDENVFAMVFVCAVPFLWYFGLGATRALYRYGLWLVIPFSWHAVFLTGSRGGLVGLAVVTLVVALRSRRKWLSLLLVPALLIAYDWQAGDVMKERAETIDDFRTEGSAAARLSAWTAAQAMVAAHPVTGVGLASFVSAFSDFSADKPREAHNTFFQIAAESGVLAGIGYAGFTAAILIGLWRTSRRLRNEDRPDSRWLFLVCEATLASVIGLTVCSLFLSLQLFEIYYYLAVMANGCLYLARADAKVSPAPGVPAMSLSPPVVSGARVESGGVPHRRTGTEDTPPVHFAPKESR